MLKPISTMTTHFCADKKTKTKDGEYKDPLLKWPLRGAAFTNEVGEALRPLIGEYATLSWAPALLYIGADVYDKYKTNKTEYSPCSQRGLKEAVFQGLASIFLPLVAVKAGQGVFSYFGLATKEGITVNSQEQVSHLASNFIANGKMRKYKNDERACIDDFLGGVSDNIEYSKKNKPFLRFVQKCEEIFIPAIKAKNEVKTKEYAKNTIKDLIEMRKNLLMPTDEFKKSQWYEGFETAKKSGQTTNVAVKSTLLKYQNSKTLKGKAIKTIGGFVALGLMIKPIDNFVENVIIDKWLTQSLEKINTKKEGKL